MAGEGLRSRSELTQRVISAVVMALAAVLTAWYGGIAFAVVWIALAGAVAYEWGGIVAVDQARNLALAVVALGIVMIVDAAIPGATPFLVTVAVAGFIAILVLPKPGAPRGWLAAGFIYAALLAWCTIGLRGASWLGFVAILYLFAVVWMTDIGAYFAGRTFGGPKFAPRISPKKTWSGVVGGLISGTVTSLAVLALFDQPVGLGNALVSLGLGVSVVFGDLFESFLKRRFGVKDAGSLIPGHGGFLDRLDGFVLAVSLAALLGWLRGGPGRIAEGLLQW